MAQTIVEASIAELQHALSVGSLTSVELLAMYLHRIATYDCKGPCLNSIPILNVSAFDEAAASDTRRANGTLRGPLDGIPYTLKDSMKYQGMTCANGSPALVSLVAGEDSFIAQQLRAAGAVCVGRTNSPPMMASGMHRGAYGRAESPYNLDYLTAAFSSGSSNGSATSTAANFAVFSLGSETVSSGRSPASNNALVAYTPSRTVMSLRGTWPLYVTCDVLVPHTRSMEDMLTILDVLTAEDEHSHGDFWREQPFVVIPKVERPRSFLELRMSCKGALRGKTIAVPAMYIGGHSVGRATVVSPDVINLWKEARSDLEVLGAHVIETNFPLVTNYESTFGRTMNVIGMSESWHSIERGELVAYAWDDFLHTNGDPNFAGLKSVDGTQIFPDRPKGYLPDQYLDHKNFLNYPDLVQMARDRPAGKTIWDIEGISEALSALEAQRKRDLDDWMDEKGIDVVVFPANGDVGRADLEVNAVSAQHALQNGVRFSNGNRAIRHLGVPTVSVPMGVMKQSKMPVNLTFATKSGQDVDLLRYAYDYEQRTARRVPPSVTPVLATDKIEPPNLSETNSRIASSLALDITSSKKIEGAAIEVQGRLIGRSDERVTMKAFVDGFETPQSDVQLENDTWMLRTTYQAFKHPTPPYGSVGPLVNSVVVVVLIKALGVARGKMVLIER